MGGDGAWEIEAVSAYSDADMVYFGLGGSNGGDNSGARDFSTIGDGGFWYKEDGVGACAHAGADALGKAS